MSISWKNWRRGFAALLIALGAHATAFAQTPTFSLEGVVTDAQQAVLPGATVTDHQHRDRAHPRGRHRRRWPLCHRVAAARGAVPRAGRADRASPPRCAKTSSSTPVRRACSTSRCKLSTVQETITVAGDAPIVQTTSSEVSSTIDRTGVREPAGQGAQLLPPADARLERRRDRHRLERAERRRPGSVELRHLRRRHQQPLEVADAAARAAARIERLRDRDGQGSAAHHQPVLRRVRRPLGRRVEHDHQERHQRGERLGVRDDPAGRPGRGAAAGADRQRREGQGAVQPAAVRRHGRRPDRPRQAVLLRQLRAAARAQPGRGDLARGDGLVVPTPADEHQGHAKIDCRFSNKNSLGVRYNMVRWKKDNESGGLSLPGTGFIWDNNVDTVHGTFTTDRLRQGS